MIKNIYKFVKTQYTNLNKHPLKVRKKSINSYEEKKKVNLKQPNSHEVHILIP